ncbi:MAG: hypothetical protein HFE36_06600, partial [Clostridia bacterium]|nr:hypothetical protein [Clostridia bacterium]
MSVRLRPAAPKTRAPDRVRGFFHAVGWIENPVYSGSLSRARSANAMSRRRILRPAAPKTRAPDRVRGFFHAVGWIENPVYSGSLSRARSANAMS